MALSERRRIIARAKRPISAVIPPKPKSKRHRLTLQDKLDAIKFCEENEDRMSQDDMAAALRSKGYGTITQPTVWRWLNAKDELRAQSRNANELSFKRIRQVEFPDVDRALQMWILQKQGRNLRLTGDVIKEKARDFAVTFGHPRDFMSLSNGWLESLKSRMGLRQHWYHGEAASAPIDSLAGEVTRMRSLVRPWDPRDVFNFDETALFFCLAPDKGLATCQLSGLKADKVRITVAFCANMDGSEKLPPTIIGHARRPRSFGKRDGRELGYDYWWNKKAWMTGSIWQGSVFPLHVCARFWF